MQTTRIGHAKSVSWQVFNVPHKDNYHHGSSSQISSKFLFGNTITWKHYPLIFPCIPWPASSRRHVCSASTCCSMLDVIHSWNFSWEKPVQSYRLKIWDSQDHGISEASCPAASNIAKSPSFKGRKETFVRSMRARAAGFSGANAPSLYFEARRIKKVSLKNIRMLSLYWYTVWRWSGDFRCVS